MTESVPSTPMPTHGGEYAVNVMFLCSHNSCRSQMADGWMRALRRDARIGVASAGIKSGRCIKPKAVEVMAEVGIDVSDHASNSLRKFSADAFDVCVTCCACGGALDGDLAEWKQPPRLFFDWCLDGPDALDPGDLSVYRRVRDETGERVRELLQLLEDELLLARGQTAVAPDAGSMSIDV